MRKQRLRLALCTLSILSIVATGTGVARALDRCTASIKRSDGTILVGARHVSGPLLWGLDARTVTNPVADANCVSRLTSSARNCTLGTGVVATTPPPRCILHLKDSTGSCSAFIRKCTPGLRGIYELPTRFTDNGDGTITDTKTGLMWEKKTGTVATVDGVCAVDMTCSDPHDVNNAYQWSTSGVADGGAFTDFLPRVNGTLCNNSMCTGLAGHSDWRLPTIGELETIKDLTQGFCGGGSGACIKPVFGPTQTGAFYWSGTNNVSFPTDAWALPFGSSASANSFTQTFDAFVRAVRSIK